MPSRTRHLIPAAAAAAALTLLPAPALARTHHVRYVTTVYVASEGTDGDGTVTPISARTGRAGTPIPLDGPEPIAMAATPNGRTIYVLDQFSGGVTPISTATAKSGQAVVTGHPAAIAMAPDGRFAYVVTGGGSSG